MRANADNYRARLKLAILQTGQPQWKMAARVGVPESVLSHVVTGARDPDPALAKRLAETLGVPLSELFPAEELVFEQ